MHYKNLRERNARARACVCGVVCIAFTYVSSFSHAHTKIVVALVVEMAFGTFCEEKNNLIIYSIHSFCMPKPIRLFFSFRTVFK